VVDEDVCVTGLEGLHRADRQLRFLAYNLARHGSSPPLRTQEGKPYTPDDRSESRWVPKLAKTHRPIAIDLPGYALSDKPLDAKYNFTFYESILEGFLDALDIHDTDLVVHDLGGPVGMFWAVRHPERAPGPPEPSKKDRKNNRLHAHLRYNPPPMPTPTSHYTQVNNLRLHYLESGTPSPNTPPILLLHGFPTSSHLYRNILPALAKTLLA
jgi:hypothetical protein